jgi:hypothetical protein
LAWLGLAAVALVAAGCNSTGVGNPAPVTLSLTSADATTDPPTPPPEAGELLAAVVVVEQLRVLPCDPQATPSVLPGPFAIDLVAGRVSPDQPEPVLIEAGSYCGIEAPLSRRFAAAGLAERSVLLHGRRIDGTEVLLFSALEATLRLRARPDRMEVGERGASWLWGLRPTMWVAPSALGGAPLRTLADGRRFIVIDADRLPRVLEAIRQRISETSALFQDTNDNGLLDPDEQVESNIVADGSSDVEL